MTCNSFIFVHIKISYCQLNRNKLLGKATDRYHNGGGKEKAAKYYEDNKEVLKKKSRNQYRDLSEEESKEKRKYGRKRYLNITEIKKYFLYVIY